MRYKANRIISARNSIALVLCLVSSGVAADPAEVAARLATGQATRIVCFGDSITGAYYHTGGERAWCDMLGMALQQANPRANLEMINAGISGHTTLSALARIDRDVIAKHPHLVVVMFGMNDVTRVPLETYRDNLRAIVTRCHDADAAVVLCTPNSVYENTVRPNSRLAEFSTVVRELAAELQLPLVDCFAAWQQLRKRDPEAWMLMMSDDIHPNMNGHQLLAQLMAKAICGKEVRLKDMPTPLGDMKHTFDRLHGQHPIQLVAPSPFDVMVPELLRKHFPTATIDVTTWPTEKKSMRELAEWAKRIRATKPDVVIPFASASASAENDVQFVRDYEWVLNWSFQFAGRPWDVVPVLPNVVQPRGESTASAGHVSTVSASNRARMMRKIVAGKDVGSVQRAATDERTAEQLVAQWIADRKREWMAARSLLPPRNDHVFVPAQSWPHHPGPRSVKASIYYPGGRLENVSLQTGIMLTLHNWGGTQCAGTANPKALADRLDVIAICVDYLQSGRKASSEDPQPYDFGYLQGLDALRALAYVRNSLIAANQPYNDGRIFCTGGSGGGNVTLMTNKLAPHTFACVIDMCGMKKLSDDIAFNLPAGSGLNARWSRDAQSAYFLSPDEQEIRFVGNPPHLAAMKGMQSTSKIVVVHGVKDATCPFADAQEMVRNMRAAELDVEAVFVDAQTLNEKAFTSTGHSLGNRTEIVFQVAGKYLRPDSPNAIQRPGPTDFERRSEIRYATTNGQYVISFKEAYPMCRFVLDVDSVKDPPNHTP